MKARLKDRPTLSRSNLSKEIVIEANGPALFEMELFIQHCVFVKISSTVIPNWNGVHFDSIHCITCT